MGLETSAVTLEISVKNLQKAKEKKKQIYPIIQLYCYLANAQSPRHPSTDICSAKFAAALFTIVRKWKEPECAQVLLLTCIVSKTSQHQ